MKILYILIILFANLAKAQNPEDNKAIKNMCGCYEVTFSFGETFSPDSNYKFHENHLSKGLEWIELVEDKQNKIVLQHLLIAEEGDKPMIIKHWRQDWLFENTDFYMYDKDYEWKYLTLSKDKVKGQWTQKVFQVDDSPRYEGTATWIHVDGKHFWENTTDNPLPRREFTTRSDYNVLVRTNRHEITKYGWLHNQDNDKIYRSNKKDQLIAQEKGLNFYKKVDDKKCKSAKLYWTENQAFWESVRNEWDKIFAENKNLALAKLVEDKPLHTHILSLKPSQTAEIKPTIKKFIINK